MAHPYQQPTKTLPPIRYEWDHLPTLRALDAWIEFAPGIVYCWALAANLRKAKEEEGYTQIRGLEPFTVAGHCVMLLGKGTPIQGARLQSALPELRIDPELETALKPPAPVVEKVQKKYEPLKVNS